MGLLINDLFEKIKNDDILFTINCGETTQFEIIVNGTVPGAADIIRFGIKENPFSDEYVVLKELAGTEGEDGAFTVKLTPDETAQLIPDRIYYCDAGLQSGDDYYYIGETAQKIRAKGTVTKRRSFFYNFDDMIEVEDGVEP